MAPTHAHAHTHAAVPPLAPSVEQAYHEKCKELRQRTKEVEDANDAAHLRLQRMKRQVLKLRLERAFLLEQLARRTSANVEDSEGSPSPGPAPEDKPLRSKRGHRKSSFVAETSNPGAPPHHSGSYFSDKLAGAATTASPAPSDSFAGAAHPKSANGSGGGNSTPHHSAVANTAASISLRPPRRPAEPFDLYASEMRPASATPRPAMPLSSMSPPGATPSSGTHQPGGNDNGNAAPVAGNNNDDDVDVDDEQDLVRGWKGLSENQRHEYQARHAREMERYEKEQEVYESAQKPKSSSQRGGGSHLDDDEEEADDDDDVEMAHDDDDDDETIDQDNTLAE